MPQTWTFAFKGLNGKVWERRMEMVKKIMAKSQEESVVVVSVSRFSRMSCLFLLKHIFHTSCFLRELQLETLWPLNPELWTTFYNYHSGFYYLLSLPSIITSPSRTTSTSRNRHLSFNFQLLSTWPFDHLSPDAVNLISVRTKWDMRLVIILSLNIIKMWT